MTGVLALLVVGLVSDNIVCPDGTECQDKNTCCPTKTGYACCQYPFAVCCADKAHCCPQGYQCDLATQQCEKKGFPWRRIPFSSQTPTGEQEKTASPPLVESDHLSVSVVSCDDFSICPDGTTCCQSPLGQWFCCMYSVGQCCRDGVHCCPFGYYCDSTSTRCLTGALSVPASSQIAAMQRDTIQDQCCRSEAGCCPTGFDCDVETRACVREFDRLPLLKSALNSQNQAGIIHCSDRFYCSPGNSCCKKLTGEWACCPYALGQCCKDEKHCCEYGYDCDSTFTKCQRGYSSIPALPTQGALLI